MSLPIGNHTAEEIAVRIAAEMPTVCHSNASFRHTTCPVNVISEQFDGPSAMSECCYRPSGLYMVTPALPCFQLLKQS